MKQKPPKPTFIDPEDRQIGLLMTESQKEALSRKWVEEELENLLLLGESHGLERGDEHFFYKLSLVLARQLHPRPRKRGRKLKWTDSVKGILVVEIERRIKPQGAKRKTPLKKVCSDLSKTPPWCNAIQTREGGFLGPNPGVVLEKIYLEARSARWTEDTRRAFKYHALTEDLEGWEKWVNEAFED